MTHVPYPGCYCADCVEGTPSERITGDKDRENPVEGAPLEAKAADKLRLRFFRECNSGTRRQLFSIFGLPLDEIRNQGAERLCFNHILAALGDNRRLAIECHRLRSALRWIADTGYVDQKSGNQNFEHLQSIARDALAQPKDQSHV